MQRLQPIVDRMLRDNPAALGDPITEQHKAYIAPICKEGAAGVGASQGVLCYEQVQQLFGQLTVDGAVAHLANLGMAKTRFKEIIRDFGINRWPYKSFRSVYQAQESLDEEATVEAQAKDAVLLPGRRLLLVHALQLLQAHPNMEFSAHPASVLRQVLHKQKSKKRKLEERHAAESAAAVLTHIRAAAAGSSGASADDGSGSACACSASPEA